MANWEDGKLVGVVWGWEKTRIGLGAAAAVKYVECFFFTLLVGYTDNGYVMLRRYAIIFSFMSRSRVFQDPYDRE